MRKIFSVAAIMMLSAVAANASTLQTRLVATAVDEPAGIWSVQIQVRTSQTTTGANGDGGLSGAQFDILSDGHGLSAAKPAGPSGPSFGRVQNVWDPAISGGGFGLLVPSKADAIPAQNPGNTRYDADGDFDSLGASFSDPTAAGSANQIGYNLTGNNWATISTQQFTLTGGGGPGKTDTLTLVTVGPLYYNFDATSTNFQTAFTSVDSALATGVMIGTPVPEPTSLVLLGMGGIGALAMYRRRRAA